MSKGIRNSFKRVFVRAAMAIAVIGAAMLVDSSLAAPRQNVSATKPALSGSPGAVNRPAGAPSAPASQLVSSSFRAGEDIPCSLPGMRLS